MFTYVTEATVIELLAEAWLLIVDLDRDSSGKTEDYEWIHGSGRYLSDEWCKMAQRTIRGFAEGNKRPAIWPWTQSEFDRFKWSETGVVEGQVVDRPALR